MPALKTKGMVHMARIGFHGFRPVLFFVALAALAAMPLAEFAQTTVYFNVPVKTSFTVTLPLSLETNASGTTAPWSSEATADINFTATDFSGTQKMIEPCLTTAFGGACQIGADTVPIFMYKNTGTVNISMYLKFNATALPAGVVVGVNSSKQGTGNNAVVHVGLYDVNNSDWAEAFQMLNISANQFINVTLYANFTNVYGGVYLRLLAHNSTQS
jgi:hypothetical protein